MACNYFYAILHNSIAIKILLHMDVFFNGLLAELPAIIDNFSSIPQVLTLKW